jgi:hypothetical protein
VTSAVEVDGRGIRAGVGGGREHLRRHRWLRLLAIVLAILLALTLLIRVIVDPIVTHYTRKGLSQAEGIEVEFQKLHVAIVPPSYEIRHFKLWEAGQSKRDPLFYVDTARVGLNWRELLHRRLSASVTLERPKLTMVERVSPETPEKSAPAKEASSPSKERSPGISGPQQALEHVIPMRVDRIDVVDGEVLFRDHMKDATVELWLNRIDATLKNLSTRRALAEGHAARLALSGRLGRSGSLALKLSADPFTSPLRFDGEFSLRGWKATELYQLLKAEAALEPTEGTVDLYVKFKARHGAISGTVKPVLKDLRVKAASQAVGDRAKAWVADKGLQLSGAGDEKHALGAEIPIQGHLDPNEKLWPAIFGVVRNAFAEGIKVGVTDARSNDAKK